MCCSSERKILENITADKCIETSLSLADCTDHCSKNNICFSTSDNSKRETSEQDDNKMIMQLQLLFNFILTGRTSDFYSNIQGSLYQCPMPINANQNSGIDPNVDQFRLLLTPMLNWLSGF